MGRREGGGKGPQVVLGLWLVSARRSTGFARLCAQVSWLLRDWLVRLGWRQFSTRWLASPVILVDWRQPSWSLIGGFLAAISGPTIGWLVLVAQFPSLLLVGQRLRSSQVAWWQFVYWLIFLLVAAFLWRSAWLSWMDTLAAVVWGCDWLLWRHLCGVGVRMPVKGLLFAILPSLLSL